MLKAERNSHFLPFVSNNLVGSEDREILLARPWIFYYSRTEIMLIPICIARYQGLIGAQTRIYPKHVTFQNIASHSALESGMICRTIGLDHPRAQVGVEVHPPEKATSHQSTMRIRQRLHCIMLHGPARSKVGARIHPKLIEVAPHRTSREGLIFVLTSL